MKCVHKYWTVLKCKFGKALTPHGQKWEGSSFIFLQSNLPWLQYTFYSFLKAVVHNHWKHPKELYFIWQFHPSSCSWCPVIVIIWRQFSLEGTGKSGLASGQVIKEGGWSPPGCDSPRSALLSWQNDQGHFCAKGTICLLHKIMASHIEISLNSLSSTCTYNSLSKNF